MAKSAKVNVTVENIPAIPKARRILAAVVDATPDAAPSPLDNMVARISEILSPFRDAAKGLAAANEAAKAASAKYGSARVAMLCALADEATSQQWDAALIDKAVDAALLAVYGNEANNPDVRNTLASQVRKVMKPNVRHNVSKMAANLNTVWNATVKDKETGKMVATADAEAVRKKWHSQWQALQAIATHATERRDPSDKTSPINSPLITESALAAYAKANPRGATPRPAANKKTTGAAGVEVKVSDDPIAQTKLLIAALAEMHPDQKAHFDNMLAELNAAQTEINTPDAPTVDTFSDALAEMQKGMLSLQAMAVALNAKK